MNPYSYVSQVKSSIVVLLVDDQMIIAEAVKRLLREESDIELHYCSDPNKAIEMAGEIKPTVILQDLVMPACDGLLLVKYFRANPVTRDIPIVVLSTKEEPKIKAEAFACGANDYIVKLPDKLELLARIRYHSKAFTLLLQRNEAYREIEQSQKALKAELAEAAAYVRSLLPPPIEGKIKINWVFIPSTQLGGDAFGYHWINERYFAIYLLDVCGHGVGAALLSISVINVLRAQNLPKADFKDPSSILAALNAAFQMENHNNMFFTIWYGVYDQLEGTLVYASAGHPPAVLIMGNSKEEKKGYELMTPGVVVGALPTADFQNNSIQIEPHNCLYVYSDGLYEINKREGPMLELQEFTQFLKTNSESDLIKIIESLQTTQGKIDFTDDVSILEINFSKP